MATISLRRLWILTSETLPEYTGGIARYIENIIPCLQQQGVRVTIVARTTGRSRVETRSGATYCFFQPWPDSSGGTGPGRRHPAYPYNVIGYWPGLSFQAAQEIKRLLRDQPAPDAIEVQDYGGLGYYLVQEKLLGERSLAGIPIFVHLHGPTFDLSTFNHESGFKFPEYWVGRLERNTIQAADGVLSPSRFLAERVAGATHRRSGIKVVPYALPETLRRTDLPQTFGRDLFYFGRIELRKGVRNLIEACARLWREGWDFRLRLAGPDTEWTARGRGVSVQRWLEQRYQEHIRAGRLLFEGPLHGAQLWEAIRSSRAVVVPSLWENFPNTCIEAMTLGVPVLVSSSGGQAEMVQNPGRDGLVFDWAQPQSFMDAVATALNMRDGELAAMGQAGRASIHALCSSEVVGKQRIAHIDELRRSASVERRLFPSANPEWVPPADTRVRHSVDHEPEISGEVSVVIPYYNLPELLTETLDSVAASHRRPCEIVIVDDGSNDERSPAVLRAAAARPGVRVVRQPNQGLAAARNTGARECRGEYLCFVDADDCIEPEYLGRCIDVLQRYENVGFVYSWVQWFEGTEEVWPAWQAEFPYLAGHNLLTAFAVVRREVFLKYGYNQPEIEYSLEDWEGWLAIYAAGWLGVAIPEPLVRYRIRAGSMMREFKIAQTHYLYRLFADLHPHVYATYGRELFLLENSNGAARLWNNPALGSPMGPEEELAQSAAERDRLWEELQVLAKAWEKHVDYIHVLEGRIAAPSSDRRDAVLFRQQAAERAAAEERNVQLLAVVSRRVQAGSDWDSYVGYKLVRWIKGLPGVRALLARRRVQQWAMALLKL